MGNKREIAYDDVEFVIGCEYAKMDVQRDLGRAYAKGDLGAVRSYRRQLKGLSEAAIAERVGLEQGQVKQILNGNYQAWEQQASCKFMEQMRHAA